MRVERRRLKAANEKRAQDARDWEAARAEKQMLGNLASRLSASEWEKGYVGFVCTLYLSCLCKLICPIIFAEIGCVVNYLADEARARYVQEKMATVELMEEEEDTLRLSEPIALDEAGLHGEEEDDTSRLTELITLAEARLQRKRRKTSLSQAAEEAEAAYYNLDVCWLLGHARGRRGRGWAGETRRRQVGAATRGGAATRCLGKWKNGERKGRRAPKSYLGAKIYGVEVGATSASACALVSA
jgi:hypothetical protein